MARAAVAHLAAGRDPEVRDLILFSPLAVTQGARLSVRVTLEREGGGDAFAFTVESQPTPEHAGIWVEHARATVRLIASGGPKASEHVPELLHAAAWTNGQETVIDFGARWGSVVTFELGAGVAVARLTLPAPFVSELETYPHHPALFDMATSIGLPLIPAYRADADFYVPLSWGRARIYAPLTPRIVSRAMLRDNVAEHGLATFDLVISDEQGRVLVEVDGFTMKRVDPARLLAPPAAPPIPVGTRAGDSQSALLRQLLAAGIRPAEGAEIFERVLAIDTGPRIVATSIDLHALVRRATESGRPSQATLEATPAVVGSLRAPPRTDVERRLAGLWREMLGVVELGVHDDFFALGGHSLIAVRLLAQVRKGFGVDLALDTLFRAPTIAAWAAIIERRGPKGASPAASPSGTSSATQAVRQGHVTTSGAMSADDHSINGHAPSSGNGRSADAAPASEPTPHDEPWTPLVQIQAGAALPPLFCVHGAGGNVVNVRDLARYLGADQPFYGLQARGVDGRLPPLRRIEEMAALYLAEIRTVQPRGPYYLGGYSGGGVIAFEMAHQLLRAGEHTSLLALIDTFCPALPSSRGLPGTLRNFRKEGAAYSRQIPRKGLDVLVRKVRRVQVRYHELRGDSLPHELRYLRMWDTNLAAIRAYRPSPYPGRIALFRAAVGDATHAYDVPDLGWAPFARGGVELYEIPGTHDTLVLEPNVGILAAHLRACLDRARTANPPT